MKGFFLIALVGLTASLQAQEVGGDQAFALLHTPEFGDILVIRESRSLRIDDPSVPTVLLPGDQVTTDETSRAEIVSYPTLARVVVGENSSVLIDRLDGTGVELTLQYGRIRGSVDPETSARLRVNGVAATVAAEEGSFGFDQLVDPQSGDVVARAYALDGSVLVFAEHASGEALADDEALRLVQGEAVTRRGMDAIAQPAATPAGVTSYWDARAPESMLIAPVDLLQTYESLEPEVAAALGSLPSYLFPPELEVEPEPVITEAEPDTAPEADEAPVEQVQAPEQPLPNDTIVGPPEVLTDEDVVRQRQSKVLRATGAIAAATGLLVDASALALNRYGSDLVTNWSDAESGTLETLSYTGGGLIASGLLLLSLSVIIGN